MVSFSDLTVETIYKKILTPDELEALPFFLNAVELLDKVFSLQENETYKGANFYPHNLSSADIEGAARTNSKILSPFTVVAFDDKNELVAIEFHEKYKQYLLPIVENIRCASSLIQNDSFKSYLEKSATALLDGSYQQADIAWLAVKNSNIDFSLGPYERYLDKLFFVKRAYQGQVGIVDKKRTEEACIIRDILYTTIGEHQHRIIPPSIVDLRVIHSLSFSGFLERAFFTQQHLPSDADTTARYGSRIVIYKSSIDYKFDVLIYPIFQAIFASNFKSSYTKEVLQTGNYYFVLLRGLAQQLHRYKYSRDRLRELFPIYDEANSAVSGVQHAKHLVLKGFINQNELEAIMIAHVCWVFSEWVIAKKTKSREDYLKGDTLTLNFYQLQGAIQEKEGISWPNFAKMFFEIENLAVIFSKMLESGSYLEAHNFLAKYLRLDFFEAYASRIQHIKTL